MRRSIISGYGLVTSQGGNATDTFDAILSGATLSTHRGNTTITALSQRVVTLGNMAADEAITHADWNEHLLQDPRTALVVGSSKGPVEDWVMGIGKSLDVPLLNGVGDLAANIGQKLGMSGPRITFASACASGLHALIRADLLIRNGDADRVLVVGAESSMHELFIGTFTRLGVLSKSGACRPFDLNRDGFMMSEAAAAICLQAHDAGDEPPGHNGLKNSIFVDAIAMAGDAHHITAVDPAGESLRYVLSQLKSHSPVDLVHAHGTATDSNDLVELAAINDLFSQDHVSVFSHKAAVGHTQGAAGMIAVVLNVMMHQRQLILPNTNTTAPLASPSAVISHQPTQRPIRRSIILAAGFGGATVGVALDDCRGKF